MHIDQTTRSTTEQPAKRLTLTRETLRTLTADELRLVNGGGNRLSNSDGPDC